MPAILEIPLATDQPHRPTAGDQRAMHAVFFQALRASAPDWMQTVHDAQHKPFTQALLPGAEPQTLLWRITLLEDDLLAPLQDGLAALAPRQLHQRQMELDLPRAACTQQPYTWLAQASLPSSLRLAFLTPTTFKRRTLHHPLPEPYSCFQSWWTRWHQFAPPELAINVAVLDIVQAHLAVSRFRLQSRLWQDGPRRIVGAVGDVAFVPIQPERIAARWWQAVATLLAFAPYSGTGHKTTQGLGQTRLLPPA